MEAGYATVRCQSPDFQSLHDIYRASGLSIIFSCAFCSSSISRNRPLDTPRHLPLGGGCDCSCGAQIYTQKTPVLGRTPISPPIAPLFTETTIKKRIRGFFFSFLSFFLSEKDHPLIPVITKIGRPAANKNPKARDQTCSFQCAAHRSQLRNIDTCRNFFFSENLDGILASTTNKRLP